MERQAGQGVGRDIGGDLASWPAGSPALNRRDPWSTR